MTLPVPPASEHATLRALRRWLLAIVFVGIVGTGIELLLLGHYADSAQAAPLVLLAAGLAATLWHAAAPVAASVRALQFVMVLFVSSGLVGIGYHYAGNEAAVLETLPPADGTALLLEAMVGASPLLAPGSMVLLGLVGLVHAYRHPLLAGRGLGI
jgi:hypothetical protein